MQTVTGNIPTINEVLRFAQETEWNPQVRTRHHQISTAEVIFASGARKHMDAMRDRVLVKGWSFAFAPAESIGNRSVITIPVTF